MRYFWLLFLWMTFSTLSMGVGVFLMDSANNYDKNALKSPTNVVNNHVSDRFTVNHPVSFRDFMFRFRKNLPQKLSDTCPKADSFPTLVDENDRHLEDERYVVQATPHIIDSHEELDSLKNEDSHESEKNETLMQQQTLESDAKPVKKEAAAQPNKTEDKEIPSFSEWTQKALEEEQKKREEERRKREEEKEKKKRELKQSSQSAGENLKENSTVRVTSHDHPSSSTNQIRLKKNFASLDCGAKVAAANAEAQSALNIITPSRDEYMLNKCNDKAWFVVELCESIKAFKVEIANFELYSSVPKDIRILLGNVIPGRDKDWTLFGQFEAKDDRNVQTFVSEDGVFGKYVKVEILSHYGQEHYCPISLFKIFGISEIELIGVDEDHVDDDLPEDLSVDSTTDNQVSDNTLIKMFKEGFRLFVGVFSPMEQVKDMDISQALNQSSLVGTTFMYNVFCPECDANTFRDVYFLLASNYAQLQNSLIVNQVLQSALHTHVCHSYGFDMMMSSNSGSMCLSSKVVEFYATLFGTSRIMALCNVIGIQMGTWTKADGHLVMPEWKSRAENASFPVDHHHQSADGDLAKKTVDLPSKEMSQTPLSTITEEATIMTSLSSSQDESLVTESLIATKEPLDEKLHTSSGPIVTPTVQIVPTPASSTSAATKTEDAEKPGDATLRDPPEVVYVMPSSTSETNGQSQHQSGRESVWQKLSNKIKALERNVSLSSGYLEELSVKYKKQIEDLQLAVRQSGEALVTITKAREQDRQEIQELQEHIGQLKIVVEEVSSRMETMSTWAVVIHSLFLVAEIFVGVLLFLACFHRQGGAQPGQHYRVETLSAMPVKRRHSFEGSIFHSVDHQELDFTKRRRSLDVNAIRKNLLDGLSRRQKKKIQRRLSRANARTHDVNNDSPRHPIQVDNMFGLLSSHQHEELIVNGYESRSLTPDQRGSAASTPSHHPSKKNGTKVSWSTPKHSKKRSKSNSPPRKVESSVAKQKDMFRKFDPENVDWIQRPKPVLTSVIPNYGP